MIGRLRRAHRAASAALLLGPALVLGGVLVRPQQPVEELVLAEERHPHVARWHAAKAEALESLGLALAVGENAAGLLALEIRPRADLGQPDVLVYWLPRARLPHEPRGLPEGALLLGSFAGSRAQHYELPQRAREEAGAILLYSLAHQRVLAAGPLALPVEIDPR